MPEFQSSEDLTDTVGYTHSKWLSHIYLLRDLSFSLPLPTGLHSFSIWASPLGFLRVQMAWQLAFSRESDPRAHIRKKHTTFYNPFSKVTHDNSAPFHLLEASCFSSVHTQGSWAPLFEGRITKAFMDIFWNCNTFGEKGGGSHWEGKWREELVGYSFLIKYCLHWYVSFVVIHCALYFVNFYDCMLQ